VTVLKVLAIALMIAWVWWVLMRDD